MRERSGCVFMREREKTDHCWCCSGTRSNNCSALKVVLHMYVLPSMDNQRRVSHVLSAPAFWSDIKLFDESRLFLTHR